MTPTKVTLRQRTQERLAEVTAALPGGGEKRAGQMHMADAVAETISEQGHALIQAGTGIGKSLAYLVPAVESGLTTVVATATIALQDQLVQKDLPFLVSQLRDHEINFNVLKGRSNYLCLQRLDEMNSDNAFNLGDAHQDPATIDDDTLLQLQAFANSSESGDRSELGSIDYRSWRKVSVDHNECPGVQRCPRGEDCFAELARRRAFESDIVVVNLHLYCQELKIGGILGDHELVIVDEAHKFADVVADAFGCKISPARVRATGRSVASAIRSVASAIAERETVEVKKEAMNKAADRLGEELSPLIGNRLIQGPAEDLDDALALLRTNTDEMLNLLRAVPSDAPPITGAKVVRARRLAGSLIEDIDTVRSPSDNDVLWVNGSQSNPSLQATPILIDLILSEKLWNQRATVLASATLPKAAAEPLGLPPDTRTLDVASPFDYKSNARLYCAADLPDPGKPGHREAKIDVLESLVIAAGGRTLALFTSFAEMRAVCEILRSRLGSPILMQERDSKRSKQSLLHQFIQEPETSLFATMSFWQGVDAPGSTCTLVVIDRLPFPRPNDPVLMARRERAGPSAFMTIDLPIAATTLAQGAGRLIRAASDRGVVAVLDPRLSYKGYRSELLNALPPMKRTINLHEVTAFLRSIRDGDHNNQ